MRVASGIKVLVVEDYESMRALVRRCLEDMGCTDIRTERNPLEALSTARTERVDLIISDYDMPEMNGLQFLASVRDDPFLSRAKFIMLSGSGDREIVQKAVALGVSDYVVKPVLPNTLKETIRRLFPELT